MKRALLCTLIAAALLLSACTRASESIAVVPVCRERIDTKYHLPCSILLMHGCILIHFICQICLICHHTINKCD